MERPRVKIEMPDEIPEAFEKFAEFFYIENEHSCLDSNKTLGQITTNLHMAEFTYEQRMAVLPAIFSSNKPAEAQGSLRFGANSVLLANIFSDKLSVVAFLSYCLCLAL